MFIRKQSPFPTTWWFMQNSWNEEENYFHRNSAKVDGIFKSPFLQLMWRYFIKIKTENSFVH